MPQELHFETPEQNQGQIVTYSYAVARSGRTIERRHDASDNTVEFYWKDSGLRLTPDSLAFYGLAERT